MKPNFAQYFKEITEFYNNERGRPMFQDDAFELCRQAFLSNDEQTMQWIVDFGQDARHRLTNIAHRIAGLRFGFDLNSIGRYGWLVREQFLDIEEIAFKEKDELHRYNHIEIGRGPNNTWTFAICMSYSQGGSSYGLTVFNQPCADREVAIELAISKLTGVIRRTQSGKHLGKNDYEYFNRVLSRIATYSVSRKQLSLF